MLPISFNHKGVHIMMKVTSSSSSEKAQERDVRDNLSVSQEDGVTRHRSGSAEQLVAVQRLSIHERDALLLTNLLEKAEAGDGEAQFELADKYYSCPESERNDKLAMKWFRAAAAQEHKEAHLKLGEIYFERENYAKALKHFEKASALGEITSRFKIAEMYENALGVEQSYMSALAWVTKATPRNIVDYDQAIGKQKNKALKRIKGKIEAELLGGDTSEKNLLHHAKKNMVEAQYLLAWHYRRELKQKKALHWFEKLADKTKNAEIYYDIAETYIKGDSVKTDQKKGRAFLLKAANLGHVGAHIILGKAARDVGMLTEAQEHYLEAAKRGDREAQNEVGFMYANGESSPQNLDEALKWIRKSAAQGFVSAQHNLGEHYDRGLGVPQDFEEARKWYVRAAEQNFAPSLACLAVLYYQGKGGPVDQEKALDCYKRVCELGLDCGLDIGAVASAYYMVGRMLLEGQGSPVDEVEGIKYLKKSRQYGYQGAHDFLREKGL